jgi:hypothetical protein
MIDILFSIKKTFAPLVEHKFCDMSSSPAEMKMNIHTLVKYMEGDETPFLSFRYINDDLPFPVDDTPWTI